MKRGHLYNTQSKKHLAKVLCSKLQVQVQREIKGVIGSTVHVATMYLINIKILQK